VQSILLAEDSSRIASFIVKGLNAHGYRVDHVVDGDQILPQIKRLDYDLLILDLGLPNRDGMSVLEELRGTGNELPVLVLTARDSAEVAVASFKGGADDYMSKPFSFEELLVRVKSRIRNNQSIAHDSKLGQVLSRGNISLDLVARKVTVGNEIHDLTPREFLMLELFLRNPGQVVSREQLLDRVWGLDHDPGTNVVDVYIRYLRKKVGSDNILTVRGFGYKIK
jgi:DNA-binding response OmpR family regulator